jgi:hypothetical protein
MSHDSPTLAGRLSQLVRIPTVTPPDGGPLMLETSKRGSMQWLRNESKFLVNY